MPVNHIHLLLEQFQGGINAPVPDISLYLLAAVTIASPFVNFLFSVSILFAVGTSTVAATGLSQMVPVFLYLKHFLGPKAAIRFARPAWDSGQFFRVVKIGLSSGLTELSAGFTVFMFNHAILRYIGEQGVVSYTIIAYVNTIVVMSMTGTAFAFSMAGADWLVYVYTGRQTFQTIS